MFRVPGWCTWLSVQHLILTQVMISRFVSSSHALDSATLVHSLLGILSLLVCAPPLLVCAPSLSFSQKMSKHYGAPGGLSRLSVRLWLRS